MIRKLTREQRINEVKELIANAEEWAGFYEHPIHDKPQREMFEGMAKVMSEHLAALSAMDSEPVAWSNGCNKSVPAALRYLAEKPRPIGGESSFNTAHLYQLAREIEFMAEAPLYRHAQQSVVDADDNFYSWFGREWQENYQHNQYTTAAKQMLGVMAESAWKAGRHAAMLQGAENADARCGNSPVIPDKWIPVCERIPEDRKQVILWDAEIGEVTSGHYSHKTQTFYHCGDAIENEITHWMPPPCAPQEVKGE